jgi:hypothetical protein
VEIVRDLERAITVYMGAGPRRGVRGQPHMDVALRETVGCFGGAMQDGEVPDATAACLHPARHFLNFLRPAASGEWPYVLIVFLY